MPQHEQPWLRHQQQRWMRPDAHRWVRPDAGRFLKPGADPAEVYPALAQKYSQSQPRIPEGRTGGGRWSREGAGGGGSPSENVALASGGGEGGDGLLSDGGSTAALGFAEPMGNIDFGDFPSFEEGGPLRITVRPSYADDSDGVQLAGDIPDGESPFEDPAPKIPKEMPATRAERMRFVRESARWVARRIGRKVGRHFVRRMPAVDAFFGALDEIKELKALTDAIKSANDPAKKLEELQAPVGAPSQGGYHDHHIVEESAARDAGYPESLIQGRDNLVRIPVLKHIDITSEYSTKVEQPDGTRISPREFLRDKDFETRRQYGLDVLRRRGVLK